MIATLFAVSLAAIVSPAPSPSPTAAPVAWQNVTLGEDVDAVVNRLGVPVSHRKSTMGTHLLEYKALEGAATLSLTESAGIVTGIRLVANDPPNVRTRVADPFGVSLGDSADHLSDLRGQPQRYDDEGGGEFTSYYGKPSEVRWTYGLRNGVVYAIGLISAYRMVRASGAAVSVATPGPSNTPKPLPPDASGLGRALRVTPADLEADPQFEFAYVRRVVCGADGHFTPLGETIINARRRNYSRVDAACTSTGEKRSFYFDITDVFGRGDR